MWNKFAALRDSHPELAKTSGFNDLINRSDWAQNGLMIGLAYSLLFNCRLGRFHMSYGSPHSNEVDALQRRLTGDARRAGIPQVQALYGCDWSQRVTAALVWLSLAWGHATKVRPGARLRTAASSASARS